MKMGVTKMRNRISAWILTLVMIVGLVAVPAGEVKAADKQEWALSVKEGYSDTSVTMTWNEYNEEYTEYIGDVLFNIPTDVASESAIVSKGISLEVTLTVTGFTSGEGDRNPCVMLYAQPGASGGWKWNQSDGEELITNTPLTLTYDLSQINWNGGDTLENLGIRFANCANGSTVTFNIESAKLVSGSSTGGGDSENNERVTSKDVTATAVSYFHSDGWDEYNYTITNGTDSPISGIRIKIPVTGSVNDLKAFGCSAKYSSGFIIISHTAVLQAHATYSCVGRDDIKFGFGGGATLGDPIVEFVYGEDGVGTSSTVLKYKLTGTTKNVEFEDTPVGKHGKLSLAEASGYSAPIIVDEHGNPFQLRGASTHGMHWEDAGGQFVNKGAFQSLRDEWGVNMVRLVSYITQGGYTDGSQGTLDSKIQDGVKAATELGMYVIIDWHVHHEDPNEKISDAEKFFEKYATMYQNYDNVIFEICNEPTGVPWYNGSGKDLYSYCKDIAQIIRDCGSNALIVCGTNTWSQDVEDVAKKPLKDDNFENILYTFHFYAGSHYEDKMNKVKTALAARTPIFVTEFGICDASGDGGFDTANADDWIKLCDDNNISYACWSLSNKGESASYLKTDCNKNSGGWLESDLATTGIWLVNTYRAHQEKEEAEETAKGKLSISVEPAQLPDVEEGKDPGTYTITVTNQGEAVLENLTATISDGSAFAITEDLSTTSLKPGESATLKVALSKNQKAGTYSGTVTIQNETVKKAVTVTQTVVEKVVPVTGVDVSPKELSLIMGKEDTATLKATVSPLDATNKNVTWSSADEKVATVSQEGVVKAVGSGDTVITVETEDGKHTATCKVNVTIPVTGIVIPEIYQTLDLDLKQNKTYDLSKVVEISPSNATNKKVTWESSDSTKVSVSEEGLVTALATTIIDEESEQDEPVTITVTTEDGKYQAQCKVSVVGILVTDIIVQKDALSVTILDSINLTEILQPQVVPADATKKTITWISSDPEIVSVTQKGILTAHKAGKVTITLKAGNITKSCTVTVVKKKQELKSVNIYKMSRTADSITIGCSAWEGDREGNLEFSVDGEHWITMSDNKVILGSLKEFTAYKVKARMKSTDVYDVSNIWTAEEVIYTLVKNPYNVDVSILADPTLAGEYVEAHRSNDTDDSPTISFDSDKNELILLEKDQEYTITGNNGNITIVTGEGDYHIILKDATVKKVDVSASDEVNIKIVGKVTVKEGIISSGDKDTDIVITGESREQSTLDTPSVRTEGSVAIKDVAVNADASEFEPAGPAVSGENVTIENAAVDAKGGDGFPAIDADKDVTIKDSNVKAKGGKNAPAVKGDKVELDNSKVDLEADSGQKGVQAGSIVVDHTDVTFNGSDQAELDDIYSVTPKDKSGKDITNNNQGSGNTGTGGNEQGSGNTGTGGEQGTGGAGTEDNKIQATSLKLTASVKGANNIPVGSTIKLAPKKKITLKVAAYLPEGAEKESVTFVSSKPSVAKVDSKGKITAGKKAGKAVITVTTASGKAKKKITVQVMKKAVSKVKIKASKTTIKVKKTVKLKATLTPGKKQASNNVYWKTNNKKVATVSSSGVVKGVKKGKAKITAVATDGSGKKATVTIRVK